MKEQTFVDALKPLATSDPSLYGFGLSGIMKKLGPRFKDTIKVGYTKRIVQKRLNEWYRKPGYEELVRVFDMPSKFIDKHGNAVYFTDYPVHKELLKMGYVKTVKYVSDAEIATLKGSLSSDFEISHEFFTIPDDRDDLEPITSELITDIIENRLRFAYENATGEHKFFDQVNGEVLEQSWEPVRDYKPRGYQERAVNELYAIYKKSSPSQQGVIDMLLSAPTRSGKTLMAAWFLLKYVYGQDSSLGKVNAIVSAKKDVYWEWKETFESQFSLAGINEKTGKKRFAFISIQELQEPGAVQKALEEADNVVVFLTLQDLSGSSRNGMKSAHKNLFDENGNSLIDFLIADECHFGVLSEVYGATIATDDMESDITEVNLIEGVEDTDLDEVEKEFWSLNPRDGRLFISATPYELLFTHGRQFQLGSNVVMVTDDDIVGDKELWYEENVVNGEQDEEDSPHFGMVQNKLSFGVNVGDPTAIFSPNKSGGRFLQHELGVNILQSLFGHESSVDNVPALLNNDAFKATGCGKNVLVIVPYRASCDVVEKVLRKMKLDEIYVRNVLKTILIYAVISYRDEYSVSDIMKTLQSCDDIEDGESEVVDTNLGETNTIAISQNYLRLLGLSEQELTIAMEVIDDDIDYYISHIRGMMNKFYAMNSEDVLGSAVSGSEGIGSNVSVIDHFAVFERLSMAMNGLNSLSSNEIFTPRHVMDMVLDALDFDDNDWLSALVSDNNGFIENGAKTGVFVIGIYERVMRAIDTNVDSDNNVVIETSGNSEGDTDKDNNTVSSSVYSRDELVELLKNSLYTVPTSVSAFVLLDRVYRDYGLNVDNIIGRDVIMASGGKYAENFAYHVVRLVDIISNSNVKKNADKTDVFGDYNAFLSSLRIKKDRDAFEKHFDAIAKLEGVSEDIVWDMVKRLTEKKFDAAVGNPPYQIQTGQNTSIDVFPEFQKIVTQIANLTAMVYPATWQKDVSQEDTFLGRFLIENGIYYSQNYLGEELFGSSIERDYPITIVACKKDYDGEVVSNGIKISRKKEYWIIDAVLKSLIEATESYADKLSGVKNSLSLSNIKEAKIPYSRKPHSVLTTRILIKEDAGKGSKAEWFYVNKDDLMPFIKKTDEDDRYSVIMQSAPLGRLGIWKGRIEKKGSIGARIIDPHEYFGTTYVSLKTFSTRAEAANFAEYANTDFFLKLASLNIKKSKFGCYVPDLIDYTDSNPIFSSDELLDEKYRGLNIEDRIYAYFGIVK